MAPKHALLDFLRKEYQLKSDRALCAALGVTAPVISRIRAGKSQVSAEVIIIIHKKTGMSIEDIEQLINEGDKDGTAQKQ